MATPQIRINQVGQPNGTPGESRDNLVLGSEVEATDTANASGFWQWFFVRPPDSTAVATGLDTNNPKFTPDVAGTYLLFVTHNNVESSFDVDDIGQRVSTQGGAAVLLSNGRRIPGVGETQQFSATFGWAGVMTSMLREDIVVKDAGSPLSGGPFNKLDFIGVGNTTLFIGDAGSGEATITISGTGGGGGTDLEVRDEGVAVETQTSFIDFVGGGATVLSSGTDGVRVEIPGIIFKDDGVNIPGFPHNAVDFVGAGVTASNAGGGVVAVTVPAGTMTVQDEGSPIAGAPHDTLNFTGAGVTASNAGGGVATINITAGGSDLEVKDEGVTVSGTTTCIDFVGAGVTATASGTCVRVEIPGVSGSGGEAPSYIFANLSTDANNVVLDDNMVWDNILGSSGTNVSLNTGTGVFTLKGGKSYVLYAQFVGNHTAAFDQEWSWWDLTANAEVSGSRAVVRSTSASTHENTAPIAQAIVSPSSDTEYECRLVANGPGNVVDYPSAYNSVRVVQIPSSGGAGGTTTFQDEGSPVAGSPHDTVNFVGAGVTATNAGGGVLTVTVPAGTMTVQDEGSPIAGAPHDTLNFTGTGVTVSNAGGGVATINVTAGSGSDLEVKEDGVTVSGTVDCIDFAGTGITATASGTCVRVEVPMMGMFQYVDTIEVDSDVTSVSFGAGGDGNFGTALNGDQDYIYYMVFYIAQMSGSFNYTMRPNGITTNQASARGFQGSSSGATTIAELALSISSSSRPTYGTLTFHVKSGSPRFYEGHAVLGAIPESTSNIFSIGLGGIWDDTSTNVTSLDIVASSANELKAGSYFHLYKIVLP